MGRIRGSGFRTRRVEDIADRDIAQEQFQQNMGNLGSLIKVGTALYTNPIIRDASAGIESLFTGSEEEKTEVAKTAGGVTAMQEAAKARAAAAKGDFEEAQAEAPVGPPQIPQALPTGPTEEEQQSLLAAREEAAEAARIATGEQFDPARAATQSLKAAQQRVEAERQERKDIGYKELLKEHKETDKAMAQLKDRITITEQRYINLSNEAMKAKASGAPNALELEKEAAAINSELAMMKGELSQEQAEYALDAEHLAGLRQGLIDAKRIVRDRTKFVKEHQAGLDAKARRLSKKAAEMAAEQSGRTEAEIQAAIASILGGRPLTPEQQAQLDNISSSLIVDEEVGDIILDMSQEDRAAIAADPAQAVLLAVAIKKLEQKVQEQTSLYATGGDIGAALAGLEEGGTSIEDIMDEPPEAVEAVALSPEELQAQIRELQFTDKPNWRLAERARRGGRLEEAERILREATGMPVAEVITEAPGPTGAGQVVAEAAAVPERGLPALTIPHGVTTSGLDKTYRQVAATLGEDFNEVRPNIDALLQNERIKAELIGMDETKRADTLALMAKFMKPEGVVGIAEIDTNIRGRTIADAQAIAMDIAASDAPDHAKSRAIRKLLEQAGDLSDVRSRFAAGGRATLGYQHEGQARQAILSAYSGAKPKAVKAPTSSQRLAWLKEMGVTPGASVKQATAREKLAQLTAEGEVDLRNKYVKAIPGWQKFLKGMKRTTTGASNVKNDLEEFREELLTDSGKALSYFQRQEDNAQKRLDALIALKNKTAPESSIPETEDEIIELYGANLPKYRAAVLEGIVGEALRTALLEDLPAAIEKQRTRITTSAEQRELMKAQKAVLRRLSVELGGKKRLDKKVRAALLKQLEGINKKILELQK